jgi:[amino group carrier protein]-L-2-aminoadipate 6-kinase
MIVIKLGGSEGVDIPRFLESLTRVPEPYILVHGANVEMDALSRSLGIEPRLVSSSSGHISRYTDHDAMDVFLMAYCGKANKRIVEHLQRLGVNAVGLSGIDGAIARGRRKPHIRIIEDGKPKVLHEDYTGSIEQIDRRLLDLLLSNGYVPVLSPPALSHEGEAINVDGDKLAVELAVAFQADSLFIFSNTAGLLADVDDPSSTISEVPLDRLDEFLVMARGRMKTKVRAAADAARRGVGRVVLAGANDPDPLHACLTGSGTTLKGAP